MASFPPWKQDVFVSFGEDDQGETFILNLFKRLHQVGIGHFGDDKREGAGRNNEAKRLDAIRNPTFAFALVLFSKNYVNSSPCLNELVRILECKGSVHRLVVIPIFYMGRAEIIEMASGGKLEKGYGTALAEAEMISDYYELKADDSERNLIDKIVGGLVNKIHSRYSGTDFTFGPFGGKGQNDWEFEKTDGKRIKVEYGDFIQSVTFEVVTFEVDEKTSTKPRHGGEGGDRTYEVILTDGEYITSFAGSKSANNKGIIDSLTFRTNKRILGPIGREKEVEKREKKEEEEKKKEEEYFSVPLDAGKITDFFWRKEGDFLESVGAHVQLHAKDFNPFQSVGLFGRKCGLMWDDKRTLTNVRNIFIRIGQKEEKCDSSGGPFIRLIKYTYKDKDETTKHGSETRLDMTKKPLSIDLGEGDYLTSISGYYTDVISGQYKNFGITSLTFRTNKQMVITIGEEKGIYFSSPATAGKIVGFYGCIDEHQHLCGIGAYFEPIPDRGPFGDWDDREFEGVREIYLPDKHNIRSFSFVYDNGSEKGHKVTHPKRVSHNNKEKVDLDYPREYLTSISGYVGENGSISSLTFYSNKRRFVFGEEVKGHSYFWYPSTGSRIMSFYGSEALDYIGVHVKPIPHLYPFKTVGPPMKGSGGDPWDDGVHTNVRGFRVTTSGPKGSRIIESITFSYDDNGSSVEGDRHGGGDASAGKWDLLDFPKDRLIRIEGFMREEDGQTIIYDLNIVCTKGKQRYAPGKCKNSSTPFVIPEKAEDGRIVGFYGRAGTHLNSIGVRLEPY